MAITFAGAGAGIAGTTSLAVVMPATVGAGDLLVIFVANKYPNNGPDTPSGWTLHASGQGSGGAGAAGADSGTVYVTVFYKIADGSEGGTTVNITLTGANSARARAFAYSKTHGYNWNLDFTFNTQNTATTNWSVTSGPLSIVTGDRIIVMVAVNSDSYTYSAEDLIAAGVQFGTMVERMDAGTTAGDDLGQVMAEFPVTFGATALGATFAMTASLSVGNSPAGVVMFMRLREVPQGVTPSGLKRRSITFVRRIAEQPRTLGPSFDLEERSGRRTS